MTRLDLSLPDDLGEWAAARAVEARLGGAGDYVAELLRRDREDAEKLGRLKAAIDEGLASGVSECDPFAYLEELRAGCVTPGARMRLELSRRAQADLDDVRDYSVGRYGAARAVTYLDAIEQVFRRVLDNPEIAAAYPGLGEGIRSLPAGEHRVFYHCEGERILILRV